MKKQDDAVLYAETLEALGVKDPMSGDTDADKALRVSDTKWTASKRALSEIVTNGFSRPAVPATKRKVKSHG